LSPLDKFDTVIPHGRFEDWAGANVDWIATAGLRGKWELANMYTLRKIPLPAVPFEATDDPNTFLEYSGFAAKLMNIAICQVSTAAGRYKDFSFLAVLNNKIVVLHGSDDRWVVLSHEHNMYYTYKDAIIHNQIVFTTGLSGIVYAWDSLHPGNYHPYLLH
jgi:hypothetical protein